MATFFNESIATWVDMIHTHLTKQYKMRKFKLPRDKYGYESYEAVLTAILSNVSTNDIMLHMRGQFDITRFVELAHAAWVDTYLKWKGNTILADDPLISVNTHRRNDRATTQVQYLSEDDLTLYYDIINATLELLTKHVLETGMKNLVIAS